MRIKFSITDSWTILITLHIKCRERGSLVDEFSGLLYYVVIATSHKSSRFQIFTLVIPCIIVKEITHVILTSTLFYNSSVRSLT